MAGPGFISRAQPNEPKTGKPATGFMADRQNRISAAEHVRTATSDAKVCCRRSSAAGDPTSDPVAQEVGFAEV